MTIRGLGADQVQIDPPAQYTAAGDVINGLTMWALLFQGSIGKPYNQGGIPTSELGGWLSRPFVLVGVALPLVALWGLSKVVK